MKKLDKLEKKWVSVSEDSFSEFPFYHNLFFRTALRPCADQCSKNENQARGVFRTVFLELLRFQDCCLVGEAEFRDVGFELSDMLFEMHLSIESMQKMVMKYILALDGRGSDDLVSLREFRKKFLEDLERRWSD